MEQFVLDYFTWNHAFVDYFFKKQNTGSLPIDKQTIEEVATKYNLSIPENRNAAEVWEDAILINCDKRSQLLNSVYVCDENRIRQICNKHSIFDFALALAQYDNEGNGVKTRAAIAIELERPGFFECPELNYVLFMIFSFSRGLYPVKGKKIYQLDHIRNEVREYGRINNIQELQDDICKTNLIPQLFDAVGSCEPLDLGKNFGAKYNVGRLKSQIVLTRNEREQLQKILYDYNITWDEMYGISYQWLINNQILSRVTNDNLRLKLVDGDFYFYFASFIRNFDRDFYIQNYPNNNNNTIWITGNLYLLYDFSKEIFLLKTDILVNENVQGNVLEVPNSDDTSFGLYSVNLVGERQIQWNEYVTGNYNEQFDASHYCFTAVNENYHIFKYVKSGNDYWLVQTLDPEDGCECLLVTRSLTIDDLLNRTRQDIDALNRVPSNSLPIFGESYNIYHIQSWNSANYVSALGYTSIHVFPLRGGIFSPEAGKKHCYLTGGLPYIQSETHFDPENIRLKGFLTLAGEENGQEVNYQCTFSEGRFLFFNEDRAATISLSISENGGNDYQELQNITLVQPSYSQFFYERAIFTYDNWGRRVEPNAKNVKYYDNTVITDGQRVGGSASKLLIRTDSQQKDPDSFRFVNLLRAYDMAGKGSFTETALNKIIDYVALLRDVRIQDSNKRRDIRYALMDLGYLNRIYDENNKPIYQTCSPKLLKSDYKFSNNTPAYLLYGSYTMDDLNNLLRAASLKFYKQAYSRSTLLNNPTIKIIPQFVLLGFGRRNPEEIKESTGIPVENGSLANDLLRICGNMCYFERDFIIDRILKIDPEIQVTDYPVFIKKDNVGYVDCGDDSFCNYSYPIGELTLHIPIPTDLKRLYVQDAHRHPVCIINGDRSDKSIYFTHEMGLPFFAKKALCLLNISMPHHIMAFGVDQCLGNDRLFTMLTNYQIAATNDPRIALVEKLSGTNVNDLYSHPMVKVITKQRDKYKLYYAKVTSSFRTEEKLCLYFGNQAIAVTKKNINGDYEVYADQVSLTYEHFDITNETPRKDEDPRKDSWARIEGNSCNEIFSRIINNKNITWKNEKMQKKDLSIGDLFADTISNKLRVIGQFNFVTQRIEYIEREDPMELSMDLSIPHAVVIMKNFNQ